jgi:hypothetical protein
MKINIGKQYHPVIRNEKVGGSTPLSGTTFQSPASPQAAGLLLGVVARATGSIAAQAHGDDIPGNPRVINRGLL